VKKLLRPPLVFVLLAGIVALVVIAGTRGGGGQPVEELTFDEFAGFVADGKVDDARIGNRDESVRGTLVDGTPYRTTFPVGYGDELTEDLRDAGVSFTASSQTPSTWSAFVVGVLPTLIIFGLLIFVFLRLQKGRNSPFSFGKSRATIADPDAPKITFADVAGNDEAVEELQEVKEFLAHPERFRSVGARIPKGVLLFGPPGTGKTLLARAVAGEADVPFFSISGSDFVEMFVGVGASRVRDLFAKARKSAPAIVFIDEIDAVGRHRGPGSGGGHDEREQTLNQLLVELDGFDVRDGVILIAGTNRPDVLDPALLRPGRFDRHIPVDRPDLEGRKAILRVHAKDKSLADDVDLDRLAKRTAGLTGADLANVLNEAALLSARRGLLKVGDQELSSAVERVLAGPERRTRVMSDHEKRVIAYHEAGHALVGHVLPGTDPIHKISIVARGRALGWTMSLPEQDRYLRTRNELMDELAMLLGGRTAEELVFGEPTTGAQNDIERATQIARAMVTQYGMSDLLGPLQLATPDGEASVLSQDVAGTIDAEIRRVVEDAHALALRVLTANRPVLDRMAATLIEHETLDDHELAVLFAGVPLGRPCRHPGSRPPRSRLPGPESPLG
jgi:cell division protease FtsH